MTRRRGILLLLLASLGVGLIALGDEASAQSVFGKNKVVYVDRDWRVFKEGQIHLYFYSKEEEMARYSLAIAIEAYEEFSAYFDYEFQRPIPIILYGSHHDFKQTNVIPSFIGDGTGGFTEFAKGRVVLPTSGSYAQLRHVLRHELVHAFMLGKVGEVMRERGIYDYSLPPLWFVEGMAENVARRKPDMQAKMVMRDAVLNSYVFPIPYLWQIAGSFLMYKHGESILDFMRTQYGEDIPVQLLEAWWRGRSFAEVLELELGLTEAELSRQWETYLKRRYYPEMLTRRSPDELGKRILRKGGMETTVAVVSEGEDGSLKLAALSARKGLMDLYLIEKPAHGQAELRRLVQGGRKARFESLPAFRSRLDTHESRYITFVAKHGGNDAIYVYDLVKEKVVRELSFEGVRQISSPSFGPQGRRVVFSGLGTHGYSDIYVANLDTQELVQLTEDIFEDVHPHWHPSIDRIVFASDRGDVFGGEKSLYTIDVGDTTAVYRVTGRGGNDDQPVWSPSGEKVLYISDRSGAFNLHLLDRDSSAQITNVTGGITSADWAGGDGKEVVASVYNGGGFSFYRFDVKVPDRSSPVMIVKAEKKAPATSELPEVPSVSATDDDYEVSMGLDFVQSAVALDPDLPSSRGANLGFTDLLGDRQLFMYFSSASQDFNLKDLNVGVSYSDLSRRWNRHIGAFRLNTTIRLTDRVNQRIETRTGGFVGLTYPFSTFDRMDFTAVVRYLERGPSLVVGERPGETWTTSAFISYVHDNTLWTWDAGPVMGSRYNITLGRTFDLLNKGFDRFTFQLDARKYHNLTRKSVFATRFVTRHSFGGDLQYFYLGGPDEIRGYDRWEFYGEHVTHVNAELRIPVVDRLALRFPFTHLEFPSIRGYLFSDTAKVSGRFNETGWIGSLGYSLAMTLFPPLTFRVDFVHLTDYEVVSDMEVHWNLSFLY